MITVILPPKFDKPVMIIRNKNGIRMFAIPFLLSPLSIVNCYIIVRKKYALVLLYISSLYVAR